MTTRDELLPLFRRMVLIRRFEEAAARAYVQGKIGGFLHLYIGQEAVGVGALAALEPHDYVIGTYRVHGLALARGVSARACMAELYGKDTGCARGLGGSMHFFDAERRLLGGHGIVGGHVPIAAGAAFKSKYTKEGAVSICFFGEGATNIGGFYEGVNLAALWRLPAVFVCENNEYSMGTPLERTTPVRDTSDRSAAFGIARGRFSGEDVLAVRDGIRAAVDRARHESLPTLIEVNTYRFRGHSMSDPGKYRTAAEVEERKKADPLLIARGKLLSLGVSEPEIDAIEAEVETEVEDAVSFAERSEPAKAQTMWETVYATTEWPPSSERGGAPGPHPEPLPVRAEGDATRLGGRS